MRRVRDVISSAALLTLCAGCVPDRVTTNDYSDFVSYGFSQTPGLGFCADPASVYSASIERSGADGFTFAATVLRPSGTGSEDCASGVPTGDGCVMAEALPARRLSDAEAGRVRAMFSALKIHAEPMAECRTIAIDPCRIGRHRWDRREHADYVCGAERLSREQARALEALLSDLRDGR